MRPGGPAARPRLPPAPDAHLGRVGHPGGDEPGRSRHGGAPAARRARAGARSGRDHRRGGRPGAARRAGRHGRPRRQGQVVGADGGGAGLRLDGGAGTGRAAVRPRGPAARPLARRAGDRPVDRGRHQCGELHRRRQWRGGRRDSGSAGRAGAGGAGRGRAGGGGGGAGGGGRECRIPAVEPGRPAVPGRRRGAVLGLPAGGAGGGGGAGRDGTLPIFLRLSSCCPS